MDAPIEDVWGLVNSFNGLSLWHDGVKESRIEDEKGDNTIGGVRNVSLKETTDSVRELLLAYDHLNHSYTYSMLSGMPLKNYVATMVLFPITETNQTLFVTKSEFVCPINEREQWEQFVSGIYRRGFASLQSKFPSKVTF